MTFVRPLARWVVAHSQALGMSLLFVITATTVLWFLAFYVPGLRQAAVDRWGHELSVRADTRRDFLDRWISEGTEGATFVATFPSVRALASSARGGGSGEKPGPHVEGILGDFRNVYGERSISIHDAAGTVLASSDGPAPSADAIAVAREAARSGKSKIDLVREPDGFISFVIAAPVLENPRNAEAGGAVLVVGDAKGKVFDLLRDPFTGATGEAVLVRRDGDSVLYLSPLRFRPDPPLTFRRPLNVPGFVAREALEGDLLGSFVDYRGARVLAAGRKLKRAPWSLVVKVDEEEALAPFRKDVLRRGLAWGGLLLASIAAAFGLWHAQIASHDVTLARTEARSLALVQASMSTDITAREAAQKRIRNLNRLLKTISEVNLLLITVADEKTLLEEVCRVLVESGGYALTWIGKADPETMRAAPVARAGADARLLDSLVVRWDDSPEGRGPTGTAIRTGRHVIVQDTEADASVGPWRAFGSRLGIRSMAVLPLRRGGTVTAALVVYAVVPSFIDEEEIALLDELAADVSMALEALDGRERARRSEQELRKLWRAVEQTPATIVITNLEAQIEYVNPRFTEVTGYTAEEIRGQDPRILKSDRTPPEVITQLWDAITAGNVWNGELCNRRKDGTHFWEQSSISPVRDDKGAITHYVSVGEDITAQKSAAAELARTQQQLLQAQKMEAVGRLAGGVAHDFNNLLTVIQGYGEMMRDSLSSDPRRESMEELLKAAGRAASLTRQLLAFSRKQVLELKIVRLDAIVRETGRMLERLIGEDIALSLVAPEDLATVRADPGQIEQVILNLAVNARDAMPGGGRLTISVDTVTEPVPIEGFPGILPAGRWVRLTVEDTGCGMDAVTLAQAFEPFFTTKERGKGTGLGLSTVYGIVRQSDGHVQVASVPGKGTAFRVYLPRSNEENTSGIRPGVLSRRGTETVLVVEDEAAVRNLVRTVLQLKGYTVLVAENAAAALEIVGEHPNAIHALLTDMVMPGMNGRDLAALVRGRRPSIKVILMSGYTADAPTDLGAEGGPVFLPKPFTEKALTAKLREALDTPQA